VSDRVECKHPRGERLEVVSGRVECTHPRGKRLKKRLRYDASSGPSAVARRYFELVAQRRASSSFGERNGVKFYPLGIRKEQRLSVELRPWLNAQGRPL
jgi:hypothetical protein